MKFTKHPAGQVGTRVLGTLFAVVLIVNLVSLYDPSVRATEFTLPYTVVPVDQNAFFDLQLLENPAVNGEYISRNRITDLADGTDWNQAEAESIIAANQSALVRITSASEKQFFQDPLIGDPNLVGPETRVSQLGNMRSGASLVIINAELLRRSGREADAFTEAFKVLTLGTTMQQSQGFGIPWLVATSIKQSSLSWMQRSLVDTQLNAEQLRTIATRLSGYQVTTEGLRTALILEQVAGINAMQTTRSEVGDLFGVSTWLGMMPYVFQPNRTAGYMLTALRERLAIIDKPCAVVAPMNRAPSLSRGLSYIGQNGVGKWIMDVGSNDISPWQYTRCRDEFSLKATTISLALTRYFQEKGVFPERLSELSPAYLEVIPNDPYGAEIIYDRENYTLQSAGAQFPIDQKYRTALTVSF